MGKKSMRVFYIVQHTPLPTDGAFIYNRGISRLIYRNILLYTPHWRQARRLTDTP